MKVIEHNSKRKIFHQYDAKVLDIPSTDGCHNVQSPKKIVHPLVDPVNPQILGALKRWSHLLSATS